VPELPELELLKDVLGKHLPGKTVLDVTVDPRRQVVLRYPPADFVRDMRGRTFAAVARRGKFLLFDFADRPDSLVVNPMLGGRFALASRAAPSLPATCFVLQLDRALDLRFIDTTSMARVYLTARPGSEIAGFAELGPDALDPALSSEVFESRLKKHRGELKNLLRNQSFIAGMGNAYSDEVLFAAKLRPLRRASTLSPGERRALYAAMRSVLASAVETIRAQYAAGKHPLHKQDRAFLQVHGKKTAPCPRCGHRLSVIHPGGEATYFCRACQI